MINIFICDMIYNVKCNLVHHKFNVYDSTSTIITEKTQIFNTHVEFLMYFL